MTEWSKPLNKMDHAFRGVIYYCSIGSGIRVLRNVFKENDFQTKIRKLYESCRKLHVSEVRRSPYFDVTSSPKFSTNTTVMALALHKVQFKSYLGVLDVSSDWSVTSSVLVSCGISVGDRSITARNIQLTGTVPLNSSFSLPCD